MTTRTLVTFLLDRSGSMGSIINETITAFNEYLQGLSTGEGSDLVDFTLVTFDTTSMDKICVAVPVAQAPKLSHENYQPRDGTPLIDAAVTTLKAIEASLEKRRNPKVVMVIQTDGHENASRKHSWEELRRLVDEKTKAGWQFVFLGAGIDAYDQAQRMGISSANTMSHGKSLRETQSAYASMASNTRRYASGTKADASFDLAQKLGAGDAYDPAQKKPQRPQPSPQRHQPFHLDPTSNSPSPTSTEFTLDP
jgi:uncharacterized protein YegL